MQLVVKILSLIRADWINLLEMELWRFVKLKVKLKNCRNAMKAAADISSKIKKLSDELNGEFSAELTCRVGIHPPKYSWNDVRC